MLYDSVRILSHTDMSLKIVMDQSKYRDGLSQEKSRIWRKRIQSLSNIYLGFTFSKIIYARRAQEILSHWPGLQNKHRDSSKKVSSLFQVVVHMNHRPAEFLHLMLLLDHSAAQALVLGARGYTWIKHHGNFISQVINYSEWNKGSKFSLSLWMLTVRV